MIALTFWIVAALALSAIVVDIHDRVKGLRRF